jgi:hypothetical protein
MGQPATLKVTFTCELEEPVVRALEAEAAAEGRTVGEVVAARLSCNAARPRATPEEVERRVRAFERHIGAWASGDPTSADNERIDADLATEYGDDHRRIA